MAATRLAEPWWPEWSQQDVGGGDKGCGREQVRSSEGEGDMKSTPQQATSAGGLVHIRARHNTYRQPNDRERIPRTSQGSRCAAWHRGNHGVRKKSAGIPSDLNDGPYTMRPPRTPHWWLAPPRGACLSQKEARTPSAKHAPGSLHH